MPSDMEEATRHKLLYGWSASNIQHIVNNRLQELSGTNRIDGAYETIGHTVTTTGNVLLF